MSSSARLSETHSKMGGGKAIFNKSALQHERKLQESVIKIKTELELKYPELTFIWEKKLLLKDIAESIGVSDCTELIEANGDPYIIPDGGFLSVEWNGVRYPILVSEAKKQGTNDVRFKKGLKIQSKGNGIERAPKNADLIAMWCERFDYNPYVIFACGCDFAKGSSIRLRLIGMTRFKDYNTNLSMCDENVTSIYMKGHHYTEEPNFWTVDEIYEIMKEIAVGITNQIIEK
jgi:type II restriction enzyme